MRVPAADGWIATPFSILCVCLLLLLLSSLSSSLELASLNNYLVLYFLSSPYLLFDQGVAKPTKATLLLPISLDQQISTQHGAGAHFLAYGSVCLDTPSIRHHLHRVTILDPIHKEGVGSRRLGHASELGKDFTYS